MNYRYLVSSNKKGKICSNSSVSSISPYFSARDSRSLIWDAFVGHGVSLGSRHAGELRNSSK